MIDIQVLRMARVRTEFNRLLETRHCDTLEARTRVLLRGLGKYYQNYPTHAQVDFETFLPYFERVIIGTLQDADKLVYRNIIKNMAVSFPDEGTRDGIIASLHELRLMTTVASIVEKYNNGEDIDAAGEFTDVLDQYRINAGSVQLSEVDKSIGDILKEQASENGYTWRLPSLNRAMRPLRAGDFIIVAARPDQGKTSFLASEMVHMAKQLDEDKSIVWLNNEGVTENILPRLYQSALALSVEKLQAYDEKKLAHRFYDIVGGEKRIRLMSIHEYSNTQVERILDTTNPGLVLYDMIDNIRGFSTKARTDQALEAMYQWARMKAVKYGAPAIATSQISVEGEGLRYPGLSMLKDSKTGKQGACDAQLMIGSVPTDSGYDNIRFLSLPKNKLRRSGAAKYQQAVNFNRDLAIFSDSDIEG